MKTSCFIGWFHRLDHSSNDGLENYFLKIAVPKFSVYIIREITTILAKKKLAKVSLCFTYLNLKSATFRNKSPKGVASSVNLE